MTLLGRPFVRSLVAWGLAGALAALWWSARGPVGDRAAPARDLAARPIFGGGEAIEVDAVDRIRLERRGEEAILLVRDETPSGRRWRQVEPFAADLDEWSARQLVIEAAGLVTARPPVTEGDAARMGFDPPTARLELSAGDRRWSLEFGSRGVAGRAFVRRGASGAPIEIVAATLHERAVEMDPREWRSRLLFPEVAGAPRAIRWRLADGSIELVRDGERWRLASPVKARADRARVEELLVALARARADGFLVDRPADLATFGLAAPVAAIEVDAEGGERRALLIGAPLGVGTADRYAILSERPTVLRLASATQSLLFPRVETLADPVASGARPADVKRIEIRGAGTTIELERQLDAWTASIDGAPAIAAPSDRPQRLLSLLCEERAPEIAFGDFPDDRLVATVILYGFDLRPLDIVRIARDPRSGKWGLENGDSVLRVHPPAAQPLVTAKDLGL